MPRITFFEEDITYKIKNKAGLRLWLIDVITTEFFKLKELSYIFCSDNYLLQINRQYLNHDYFTDIITFDNSTMEKVIVGDIFISIDRVRENALKFNVPETDELNRVVIHGVLHLLGYNDKTSEEKKKMTIKEDFYLAKRPFGY